MKKKVIFLILFVVLYSCVKEIDLPVKYEPRKNVSCVLIPGREVQVQLTSNYPILDSLKFTPIVNAKVELFRGNNLLGLLTYKDMGIYTISVPIVEGQTYTLKASCNGYPPIEASTTVPNSQIFNVYWSESETLNLEFPPSDNPSYYAFLTFTITKWSDYVSEYVNYVINSIDNTDKKIEFVDNSFDVYNLDYLKDFTQFSANQELRVYSPTGLNEALGSMFTLYLSNDLFIGQKYSLKIPVTTVSNPYIVGTYLNVYQLSPELYKTFMGIAAQNEAKFNRFVTPVSPYNSVKGGSGFFGAALIHTTNIKDIK